MIMLFMNNLKKIVFNWSGGKDSALALLKILQNNEYEVVSLLTTINIENNKSSIHAIPLEILEKQASSIGIPLFKVYLSKDLKNYEKTIHRAVTYFRAQGIAYFAFGDIFLEDIKAYRESKLKPLGIEVIEPLWNKTSDEVMSDFLSSGIKTKIIVTQADKLPKDYIGKNITKTLIETFPEEIDICGENGEYHTLAYDGILFQWPIEFSISEITLISYDIVLDTGENKRYDYWQAELI